MIWALLVLLASGCTTEEVNASIWTLHIVGETTCPSPDDARELLVQTWGPGGHDIDGDACSFEEIVDIAAEGMRAGISCCYATECSGDLDLPQSLQRFDAACLGDSCARLDPNRFTPAQVEAKLVEHIPQCSVAPMTTTPANTSDLECTYTVTARYTCRGHH